MRKGNCYVTSEALFHLLGGKDSGYKPCTVRHEGFVHWFLVRLVKTQMGVIKTIIDPTSSQFKRLPPYHLARGRGFLTKAPSRRARAMMDSMVYQ